MTQHSFKSLMRDGVFKRVDGFTVAWADLVVEPGFNLREEGHELDAHVDAIFNHLMAGGEVPPLEVRVDGDSGKVVIVDGHCRHRAYGKAIEAGAPIERIAVVPFRGNDVDRVARIITSQEGRKLTPLELAKGYKRLRAFRMSADDIAKRFSKTRQHVEQMLTLADANDDVHQLVAAGDVSAALAVEFVRKYGEKAGAELWEQLGKAKAAGKRKITPSVVRGPSLPRKVTSALVDRVDEFMRAMPNDVRHKLAELENRAAVGASVNGLVHVPVPAALLLQLVTTHAGVVEARQKAEARLAAKVAQAGQGELEAGEA